MAYLDAQTLSSASASIRQVDRMSPCDTDRVFYTNNMRALPYHLPGTLVPPFFVLSCSGISEEEVKLFSSTSSRKV